MSAPGASPRSAGWAPALAIGALLLGGAAPAAARTLVSFHKSGGIAGVLVSVTVSASGSVKVSDNRAAGRSYRLSAARLRGLRRVLAGAKVGTLKTSYVPRFEGADFFTYRVRYAGRSIVVQDGGNAPERLLKVIARMGALARG